MIITKELLRLAAEAKEAVSAAPIPQGSHALAELRDLTECRCIDAYKDRDMTDPDCNHQYREDVEAVAAALAASEARVAELSEQVCTVTGWCAAANERAEVAEQSLAEAIGLLRDIRPVLACADIYNPCADLRQRIDALLPKVEGATS